MQLDIVVIDMHMRYCATSPKSINSAEKTFVNDSETTEKHESYLPRKFPDIQYKVFHIYSKGSLVRLYLDIFEC